MCNVRKLTLTGLLVPPTSLRSLALLSLSVALALAVVSPLSLARSRSLSLSLSLSLSCARAPPPPSPPSLSLRVPRAWKIGLRGYGKAGYDVTNKYIGVGGKR
jgi:hypothetical protein